MSEEKPTFKITDRRLFNPDGSPREIEREEPAATPETSPDATTAGAPTVGADSSSAAGRPEEHARSASDAGPADTQVPERGAANAAATHGPAAEEEDPQEFLMVVEFIASFAADALGMVNHPGAGGREINPPLAKQCIDMLGTLQRKTRGNLGEEEEHFLTLILSQLRMQYVSITSARPTGSPRGGGGGRGFTGSDITGGR